MSKDYVQGYYEALEELDQRITESIKRNGDGRTTLQMVHIFNDTIALMSQMKSYAKSTIQELNEMERQEPHYVFIKGGFSL